MDNKEFYTEKKNPSKDYADRYKNCKLLVDTDTGESLLSTREIVEIPVHPNDIYHRVQSHEKDRFDILAHKYYQNPLLWWVIAQANGIYDPFHSLQSGDMIRIPAIETLYGNNGILL